MHSHKTHLHYLLRNEEKSCDTSHYKADDVTLSAVNNTATDLTADLISSNEKAESLFFPDVSSSFFEEFQRDDEDKDCSLSNTADDFPFDAGKNTVDQAAEIFSFNDMAKYPFQMNFFPPTGKNVLYPNFEEFNLEESLLSSPPPNDKVSFPKTTVGQVSDASEYKVNQTTQVFSCNDKQNNQDSSIPADADTWSRAKLRATSAVPLAELSKTVAPAVASNPNTVPSNDKETKKDSSTTADTSSTAKLPISTASSSGAELS